MKPIEALLGAAERAGASGSRIALVLASIAPLTSSCSKDACEQAATCSMATLDAGSEAGLLTDASADADVAPRGCDPTADPKDAPSCVVDGFGVFVDGTNG